MITCYKEEEGERCTILLDIIRTEKEEEEEEEEFRIPACAETVAQIFLTKLSVTVGGKMTGVAGMVGVYYI